MNLRQRKGKDKSPEKPVVRTRKSDPFKFRSSLTETDSIKHEKRINRSTNKKIKNETVRNVLRNDKARVTDSEVTPSNSDSSKTDSDQENQFSPVEDGANNKSSLEEPFYESLSESEDDSQMLEDDEKHFCVTKESSVEKSQGTTEIPYTFIYILVIFMLFVFSFYATQSFTKDVSQSTIKDQHFFIKELVSLKKKFANQHPYLWRLVLGAFHFHHSVNNNTEPAVLFLGHQLESETTECLSVKLAQLYSHNCDRKIAQFNGKDFSSPDSKMKLYLALEEAFDGGACAIVVKNFDKIDPMSTLIFYRFCDNTLSLYNNKAIIFSADIFNDTLPSQPEVKDSPEKWEEAVTEYLTSSLKSNNPAEMTTDRVKALLSRVTPLVGFVKADANACL